MTSKHTELPWKVWGETYDSLVIGKEMDNIAYIPKIHPEAKANAAFIVKSANLHHQLVRACDMDLEAMHSNEPGALWIEATNRLQAIITKAKED